MNGSAFGAPAAGARPDGPCPCGSGVTTADCCGPILAGQREAETAPALMRSRYTAHVVGDGAHLARTWHPATRPEGGLTSAGTVWTGLVVHRCEAGGPRDEEGLVEFTARYRSAGSGPGELHETSRFVRRRGRWVYLGPR